MPSFEEVDRLGELLYTSRQALAFYTRQIYLHGGDLYAPLYVLNKIHFFQEEIARICSTLQAWGFNIDSESIKNTRPLEIDIDRHLRWLQSRRAELNAFYQSVDGHASNSSEIFNLRTEIWRLKMTLQEFGAHVTDITYEDGITDENDVEKLEKLRNAYYRVLADNLTEAAMYGGVEYSTFDIFREIYIAKKEVRHIKGRLRKWGIQVNDFPEDEDASSIEDITRTPSAFATLPLVTSLVTKPKRPLRVFLCHSSKDKSVVRGLHNHLWADGFQPWLDERDILPGQDWDRAITNAVWTSDVVIVCLSRTATDKAGYIQKEIRIALDVADLQPESTIYIIPVRLEECIVPERLRRWQWVDLFTDTGYTRLSLALKSRHDTLEDLI